MNELIDKRKELLQTTKDLYSYEKNISEQTKEIASLEKQLKAFSGDDSEETRATIQKLKQIWTPRANGLFKSFTIFQLPETFTKTGAVQWHRSLVLFGRSPQRKLLYNSEHCILPKLSENPLLTKT